MIATNSKMSSLSHCDSGWSLFSVLFLLCIFFLKCGSEYWLWRWTVFMCGIPQRPIFNRIMAWSVLVVVLVSHTDHSRVNTTSVFVHWWCDQGQGRLVGSQGYCQQGKPGTCIMVVCAKKTWPRDPQSEKQRSRLASNIAVTSRGDFGTQASRTSKTISAVSEQCCSFFFFFRYWKSHNRWSKA